MNNDWATYLPIIAIALVLLRRTQRSRRVRPKMLWIAPAVLLVMGAAFAAGAVARGPHFTAVDLAIILGAAALGAGIGALRAHNLHLTRHPETGEIESKLSMVGLIVILVWLVGRRVLEHMGFESAATPFGAFSAAMIALALASVTTRAIILSKRCAELETTPGAANEA